MVIPADPVQRFPVMKNDPVGFPDTHSAIVDMIGFGAAAVELKDEKVLALFQVFDRSGLDIITAIIEFIGVMAQFIKDLVQVLIDLLMQVGEMGAAVMVTGIR